MSRDAITGGRAKRYIDASAPDLHVHSSTDFAIEQVTPASDQLGLLIVGDTNVGHRRRRRARNYPWLKRWIKRTFSRGIARTRDPGVDAVIRPGDVFDHGVTPEASDKVREEIQRTHDVGSLYTTSPGTTTTRRLTGRYVEAPGSISVVRR